MCGYLRGASQQKRNSVQPKGSLPTSHQEFPSKNHLDENYIAIVNLVKVEMFHHGRESQIVGSVEDQRDTLKNQDER